MICTAIRTGVLALALAAPLNHAAAQAREFQGAWVEEGFACEGVFTATRRAVAFKRPASAFAPAFIISGRQLSTPLASCRIVGQKASGERQILNLHCTTSIASDSARAVLAPAPGGGIFRYLSPDGEVAAKYQRCGPAELKTRDGGGTTGQGRPAADDAVREG